MRKALAIGGIALALLLGGCSAGTNGSPGSPGSSGTDDGGSYRTPSSDASEPAASGADLMVAETSVGEVVVDADGMTVYMFDKDTQGTDTSACTGVCLQNWPPLIAAGDEPHGDGVTGDLGTIETADGKMQVTLNGWPLYYFAGDSAAGDVNGQGVNDVWWVLSPAGERMAG
ncbi:COG4315 family predicted lipoprotein [Microbacterium sp. USHLN186]|uniref:COG4315 family predicted lipoprotein n=1 Tax=Microbacterium sp. USHLN186 TaxID=3081286 RepID=UPI0030166F4B